MPKSFIMGVIAGALIVLLLPKYIWIAIFIVILGIYLLIKKWWLIKKVFDKGDNLEPSKNLEVDLEAPTKEGNDIFSYYSYRIFGAINERTANENGDNNKIKIFSLGKLGKFNVILLIIKFILYIPLTIALFIIWIKNPNEGNIVIEFFVWDINITLLGSVVLVCIIALFETAHHCVNIILYSRGVFAAGKDRQVSQREINQMKHEIKALREIIDPFKEKNDI